MDNDFQSTIILSGILIVGTSFSVGIFFTNYNKTSGKQWIDLLAAGFGGASFLAALISVVSLLKYHQDRWVLDYPMIGILTGWTFALPVFLAIALGLTLAKRWVELKLASNKKNFCKCVDVSNINIDSDLNHA